MLKEMKGLTWCIFSVTNTSSLIGKGLHCMVRLDVCQSVRIETTDQPHHGILASLGDHRASRRDTSPGDHHSAPQEIFIPSPDPRPMFHSHLFFTQSFD